MFCVQAFGCWHWIVVFWAVLLMAPEHVSGARHWTWHEFVALQSIVPAQLPELSHKTVQVPPPQVIAPHVAPPPQTTVQALASEQSTPPLQAPPPVQSTKHGCPGGHRTEGHGF
jgi:hypothetical protein